MKTLHTIYTSFAKRLVVVLALLTLGVTSAWAQEEELVYTLDGTVTGGTNGYDTESTITQSNISWSIKGNTLMEPWRIGGKSLTNVERAIYSTTAINDDISKIVITHGTASSITVNSMTVIVSTIKNGGGTVISTLTPTFSANGDVTITRPDGKDWSKAFYKIVYNVTVSSTSNKFIEFTSAKFYKTTAPSTFSVTYDANGASGTVPTDANKYASGEKVTAKSHGNLTKTGYSFTGWKRSDNYDIVQENTTFTMPASDLTLTAQWTEKALTNYRTSCSQTIQLDAPTNLLVTDVTSTSATLSWGAVKNAGNYTIIIKKGDEKVKDITAGGTTCKVTGLDANTEYTGCVYAVADGYTDSEEACSSFETKEELTDNCRWVEIALEDITPEDEIVVTMGNDKTVFALGTEKITNSPKSQEITITSGMIDINQDFNYSKYTWSISTVAGGYQLQPYGTTQYLYGVASYITISSTPTTFSIFTSPENGNKCFMYTIGSTYYLGHGAEDGQTAWKRVTTYDNLLKSNTLKFYKKTCLPANKFWIDYELANITCTTNPTPSQIDQTGEDLLLEFSANDGYKLPETISVKMGETEIGNNENYCVWGKETGALLIAAEQITDNITITIEGCERLATPTNLSVPNITSTSATLSWNAVTNADEYRVCVMDGETKLQEFTTTETSVNVPNLKKNSFYTWDVVAEADDYCESQPTAWIELTTLDVYAITFNTNGGTPIDPQTVDHGTKATKPANPTKTGYTFAGWYTEADTEFDFNTPITSATTIYAKWNANQYTITFSKRWGDGGTDKATVTFNSNNFSVVTIELPTRDGYEFGGYYTETGGAGLQIVDAEGKWLKNKTGYLDASGNWIKAESVNLYAKWTKIHTITWVVNNNTETPYYTSMVLDGNTIDELPNAPADDLFADCDVNAFVGWSTDNIGLDPDPTAPTDLFKTVAEAQNKIGAISADKKFYAVYAEEIESTTTFKRVHELSELNTSSKIAIINAFNKTKYILPTSLEAEATTPSENLGEITIGDGQYWNIEKDGDNWKFKSGNKYLAGTTIPTNNNKTGALALTESEDNTTWTIVKNTYEENGTPVFTIYNTDNTTAGLEYSNGWILYYATDFNTSWFTLNLYVPRTTYSNYITRCTALPDPVWGGAIIDKTEIAVNCGETSSTNGAAKISFLKETNYNLYKDIAVEVTSGNFIIATSRDGEYSTYVTLTPTQSGTNVGTLDGKYVYVRAVAPAMSDEDFTGTITISGKQLAQDQVIEVTAEVSCTQYTLTFNDQGQTKTVEGFAGTSVVAPEPWAGICTEPIQYVFDGWATASVNNGTAEYEKVDFSTFTMPAANTTLYAVYRYAEEGGEPVNGYVKVTEALADWSGDYVIVNETAKKAIGNTYANTKTLSAVDVEIEDDKVVSPSESIIWQIRKDGDNYTMYNADAETYAYITGTKSENAGLSDTKQNITISWGSSASTIRVCGSGEYTARCFSYFSTNSEWRTYSTSGNSTGALYRSSNKTIRYTSSLVCGIIEAENAIVTSTVGQTIKVYVPITLGYSDAASITGTSDNEAFTVVTKNDVAVGESTIEVHYKPTAYVNTANQEEKAAITLTTSNGATTTFNITGRCLPETFAIVAKVGNVWYALPSQGLNSTTPPAAYPVEVDDMADPTAVTAVPANADWSLRQVYASSGSNDRFAANGENLVFVNKVSPAMALNASQTGNYLLTDAQYNNYYSTYPGLYEWTPTTNDLETYTLTNAQRTDRTLNVATNTVFGVHSDNRATTEVRFLPIQNRYTPAALQVVAWKENSVVIMYNGNPAQTASVSVNGAVAQNTTLSAAQRDIAVYELAANDLAANPTQRLSITIGSEKTILSIPYIINSETTDATILPGSTVAARQEVAKVSDLVILKDATLTAAGAKGNPYKFRNVTVYGGGKLVVPADNGFGVNSLTLRIGGVTEEGNYDYVYPEFELNTTYDGAYSNTSGKINLDYVTTKSQYYTFVAPFEVETKDIKYPVDIYGSNVEAANRGSFEFQYYDGKARAAGEKGWKVVEEDPTDGATLTAHQGYTFYGMPKKVSVNGGTSTRQKFGIHRIPMTETAAKVMSHENSEQTIAVSAYPSQYNINAGWNLIGNPYMSTITGLNNESIQTGTIVLVDDRWQWSNEADQYNHRFIVFPSNDGEWYYTSQASNANLPAFKNFFVQIAGEEINAISIPFTHRAPSGISARRATYETDKDIEMAIVLEKDEAHSDQMDFLINDAYGAGFDYNADFTKMMNNTQLNLYGVLMEDNLSFVALDHFTARGSIAIGYQVPSAGEYTLRISDKPYVMLDRIEALYVTDHEMNPAVTTNLMEEDYVFHVGKAEINDTRFTISLTVETNTNGGDITTNLGEIDIHNKQPQKFFYDGELYILHDGKVYSATGHEIKTINE